MENLIEILYKRIPFYKTLGLRLEELGDGHAIFKLDLRKELTQNGIIHGGVLASLIDSACACAALSLTYPKAFVTTIDLQIAYLKPVSKGTLTAKAECIKSGKTIFFCEAKIFNDEGDLICKGSSQLVRIDFNST
jgi:uncharacterized protein (TIGR00369 family)